jgi:hypothetical protein
VQENQIRRRGITPWALEMVKPLGPRRQFPMRHLHSVESPAARSSNAVQKTHASPSSAAEKS